MIMEEIEKVKIVIQKVKYAMKVMLSKDKDIFQRVCTVR